MLQRKPAAPRHLSAESKRIWRKIAADFDLYDDDSAMVTLRLAMEARDRCEQARQRLARDGIVAKDRFGQLRAHPAVAIERDARIACIRCLRELSLDGSEAGYESARPPRIGTGAPN